MKYSIHYIDRVTKEKKEEAVYGGDLLYFLYSKKFYSRILVTLLSRFKIFSYIYGFYQRLPWTKHKISPFVKRYQIDPSEFLLPIEQFKSFDDFFTRRLKAEARPIQLDKKCAIIPTDGRYLFYQNIEECDGFIIKGKKFSIAQLLKDPLLAKQYANASMLLARLCPTDYHRFHFPCDGTPKEPRQINGWLYSVNPIAIRQNISILIENKRVITEFETQDFGKVVYIEVGATNVGSIHQTFKPNHFYKKGDEKGYFSFGGSALVLLFEPNRITFDADLVENSAKHLETFCMLGQSLGS